MRYFVMAEPHPASRSGGSGSTLFSSPALDILESSALGTPLPGPAGAPHRYMKLPHPSTCNKVLNKAVQVGSVGGRGGARGIDRTAVDREPFIQNPNSLFVRVSVYLQESHGASVRAAGAAEVLLLQGIPLEPNTLKVRRCKGARAGGGVGWSVSAMLCYVWVWGWLPVVLA